MGQLQAKFTLTKCVYLFESCTISKSIDCRKFLLLILQERTRNVFVTFSLMSWPVAQACAIFGYVGKMSIYTLLWVFQSHEPESFFWQKMNQSTQRNQAILHIFILTNFHFECIIFYRARWELGEKFSSYIAKITNLCGVHVQKSEFEKK